MTPIVRRGRSGMHKAGKSDSQKLTLSHEHFQGTELSENHDSLREFYGLIFRANLNPNTYGVQSIFRHSGRFNLPVSIMRSQ
jgi:hypothetical protein